MNRWPHFLVWVAAGFMLTGAPPSTEPGQPSAILRVCADPNNLPFTNQKLEGYENKLAELIASEMRARVEYFWSSQRKNFVRNTLNAKKCDVVIGIPAGYEKILTTKPYYRSTYVWVTRRDRGIHLASIDDPVLQKLRIGVHVTDDSFAPPAQALARRGIVGNIKGYSLLGELGEPNPPARIVDAVAKNDIDVAIAWGPLVGYFARRARVPLSVAAIAPGHDGPIPFTFEISMGVRQNSPELLAELNRILARRQADVRRILASYGVPEL